MGEFMMMPIITEKEFCEHIEDDDFPILYGNPVFIYTNDGRLLVCMTFKLYERLLKRKELIYHSGRIVCAGDSEEPSEADKACLVRLYCP